MKAALLPLLLIVAGCGAKAPTASAPDPLDAAIAADQRTKDEARFTRIEARLKTLEDITVSTAAQRTKDARSADAGSKTQIIDRIRLDQLERESRNRANDPLRR